MAADQRAEAATSRAKTAAQAVEDEAAATRVDLIWEGRRHRIPAPLTRRIGAVGEKRLRSETPFGVDSARSGGMRFTAAGSVCC